ncbi:MAG: hypothetical protein ATN35_05190 [Epulopiscium sp. Nele67-Bin004]|nr:MAG: hypothetical protein ATN35_05190 [Epulopiscium sp. Nele67-Bin004]
MDLMILLSRYFLTYVSVMIIIFIVTFCEPINTNMQKYSTRRITWIYKALMFLVTLSMILLVYNEPEHMLDIGLNYCAIIVMISALNIQLKRYDRPQYYIGGYTIAFLLITSQIMLTRLDIYLASRQLLWIGFAVVVGFSFAKILPLIIKYNIYNIYCAIIVVILCLPFIFGEVKYGALNWATIGPVAFQPSELVKVLYIIVLSQFLTELEQENTIKKILALTAIVSLILVIQRDLGTALVYILTSFILVYVATNKIIIPIAGLLIGAIGFLLLASILEYVQLRIEAWLYPWENMDGSAYQLVQGFFAMGTWGAMGSGLGRGMSSKVPLITTDFIYVAIVEELGTIIGLCVISCYIILTLWAGVIASRHHNELFRYITFGYITFLTIQTFIILGGILQLIPLTGVTLPLVSYGGSSMFSSMCMILTIIHLDLHKDMEIEEIVNE